MSIEIHEANLAEPADAEAFLELLDGYARDPMGGATPLDPEVRRRLVPALREQPQALVLLARASGKPIGLATCFYGFSTFAARPVLNVHDLAAGPAFRQPALGPALLFA